ncbi:MAG: 50S ribosomal protein L18Ae [ANME-2 cluster archaeon]|nr:50S ribosomal protein L18Ae [ANME-2 cluster archaeon]
MCALRFISSTKEKLKMENYIISGTFKAGDMWESFTKNVSVLNEKNAREKVYSLIGSEHGLKRNFIRLDSITRE